ncbi:hypothetical protein KR059_003496 [Drosophila kikkawai]|nr:hypothetical protein KR059_003496 [Drosophila kikkawai]
MFTTLHSEDTEYSADSVEWLPQDGLESGYFACGTYQLVQAEGEATEEETGPRPRKGRVYLYHFGEANNTTLERLQCIETAAILDMKWLPALSSDSGPQLATVSSVGELEVYEFDAAEKKLGKRTCLSIKVAEGEREEQPLALALDWRQLEGENQVQLAISDSKGGLNLLTYSAGGGLTRQRSWPAHGFEAWTCAFDRWSPHLLYSGGDDMLLLAHDLRTEQRAWTNRAHMAGVTCLLSHPGHEHHLLTGSYDEQLRLFDTRSMKRTLAEQDLGGGIWRLKPHRARPDLILAACMYTNFSVVQLDAKEPALRWLGAYEEHKSICYGADWAPSGPGDSDGPLVMATCSFYDHKLCVSRVEISQ